ncbi:hypothetical protein [Ruegeria sp. HKCCD7303]|uniref:hypothetical protein n=1 Tax=Ruegeria sp. HKCCD7303 TaxID=2683013 RepID=UPI001491A48A|nr:hypothetical protein [Ruegeria sp. HKCCD7303]NOD67604.1 hypothetical protein [Ruegeria sp. HKCCD7303]
MSNEEKPKMNRDYRDAKFDKEYELECLGIDIAAGYWEKEICGYMDGVVSRVPVEDVITAQRICETLTRISVFIAGQYRLDPKVILIETLTQVPSMIRAMEVDPGIIPEAVPNPPRPLRELSQEEMIELARPLVETSQGLELTGSDLQHIAMVHLRIAAELLFRVAGNARSVAIMIGVFGLGVDHWVDNSIMKPTDH